MNEQAVILNCHQSKGECPRVWGALFQTGDRMIRQCMTCMHTVYYTDSQADAECRAANGQFVAIAACMPAGAENDLASHSDKPL